MSDARFQRFEAGRAVLWVDPEFADAIAPHALLEPGALERVLSGTPGPSGRGETALLPLTGRPERIHLRPLRHGGWLAPLWRGSVAGLGRALSESDVTAALRAAGAPVPRPALVLGHRQGPLWRAAIGTVYEENTESCAAFLSATPDEDEQLRVARTAARAIRVFHDAGGRHPDLHIGNLIVRRTNNQSEVLIVDLDRARSGSATSPARRMREVMRLDRSLRKRSLLEASRQRLEVAFLDAYVGGDRGLRASMLQHLPRELRRIARHAGLWRFTLR